ncbi:MAG: PAS domain S-box protein [Nitrospira sp.]|nr:PAS domain S-box protein [Nitrospira sp.]
MSATSHPPELDLLRKQVADLARELTERDQALRHQNRQMDGELQDLREESEMLRAIVAGTAAETGEDFFQALVRHLCSVFSVQYAIVGEVQSSAVKRIRTIAVSSGGSLVENFDYLLAGTPCEIALKHSFACFDQDVRASFPACERLDQLSVESYCGVPLRAKDGTVIGLLAVMDTTPLRHAQRLKSLMTVFVPRAGAELQRRQIENELRHRQRHLIESQALAHLGSWDWELWSGNVWWSDEQYRLLGHEPGTIPATHDTFLRAVYPDDRGDVQRAIDAALAGRARFDMECRIVRPNGEIRVISCRGEVFRDRGDQPISMSGSMLDITNRQRVEEALRTSQEKLRQALQASGTGLWDWNTDTNEVVFSEEWRRQLGYERTELSGSFETWASLLHPEDRDRAMAYVQDYLAHRKGEYRQEFRLRHKNGTYRWIEARASFVTEADGRRIRLLGSHTDITDRKQMEETVRESEERYRTLVELSPSGVFVFCEGRTTYINHTGSVLLGARDAQEILNRPTFDFIHPDYHQEVRENVTRLLSGGVSVHSAERIYFKLDGTPIPVQVEAARIMWNGKPAILGLFSDITERKEVQEAVAALNASLERQVCDRTEALRRSEERFRQFFDNAPNITCLKDHDGRYLYTNRRFDEAFGFSSGVALGKTDEELFSSEQAAQFRSHDRQVLTSGRGQEFEEVTEQADGLHTSIVVKFPVVDAAGHLSAVGIIATDITERRQAQDALRESQARFQQFAESVGSAFLIADMSPGEMEVLYVNAAFTFIWGIEREEICRNGSLWFDSIHPEDRDRVETHHDRFLAGGTTAVFYCEYRIVGRDGYIRWIADRRVRMAGLENRIACIAEDITTHKQQLALMKQTEAVGKIGGWELDIVTNRLRWSEETHRLHDTTPDTYSPTVETALKFYTPESRPLISEALGKGITHGVSWDLELELITAMGRQIAVRVAGMIDVINGRAVRAYGTFQDITQRKRAEEALRQAHDELERKVIERTAELQASEERYARATAVGKVGVWELDVVTGQYHGDVNLKALFGYGSEELSSNPFAWLDLVHQDDQPIAMKNWDLVQSGAAEECHYELRMVRKDGLIIWTDVRCHAVRDANGRLTRLIGATVDITERKEAELALRASEELFSKAFRSSPDPMILVELDSGRWLDVNDACLAALGYQREQVVGRKGDEVEHWLTPDDQIRFIERLLRDGSIRNFEAVFQAACGERRDYLVSAERIEYHGKSCMITLSKDITKRRQAEQALWKSQQAIRALHDISSAQGQSFKERVEALLQLGCRIFELPIGMETVVRGEELEVKQVNAPDTIFHQGMRVSLDKTYCAETLRQKGPISFEHAGASADWTRHPAYAALKLESYIGTPINGIERTYGTLCFVGLEPRAKGFTESEKDFVQLMARWLGGELDRQAALDDLRESEERFSKAFRTSPHPIKITEVATGRCIEVNDACLQAFGFRREEVIGNTTLMLGIWPNLEDRARVIERLKAGQQVRNMEVALKTKSGALRYFLASADLAELNGTLCVVTVANDITDRKHAEEALRLSEERFAKAFRASPHPVVISELDTGRVVDVNDAACQMFGYCKEEVVEQTTLQIGLWHSVEERARYLDLLKRQGSVRNVEVRLRSRNGEVRQCLLSSEVIMLNGTQCSVTVGDDITERKRMEKALRLTQFSVDQAVEAILWLDPTARIFNVNDTACRMLGYSRPELTSMTVHDIDPNFPIERWAEHWDHVKEQGALAFEAKYWSSTGHVLEMEVTFNYLQYDGKEYGCAILRDIGERKRAEAELRRSHTFLRQVIDTDPGLIFAKDREGRFAMANKAVADWYGTTVDDLVGKSDADFNSNADEVEFFRENDLEVMNSGQDRFIPEEKFTDVQGHTRWLQTVKRPIFDDDGRVHMVLGAATDITERKRMEEMLLQRERDLSAALQERERISQDLHDGILQSLYAVGLGLEGCKPMIKQQPEPVAAKFVATLDQTIGQLNHVMGEVRNFIAGLESHVIQGGDFPTALRTMVRTMSSSSRANCLIRIDEAAARRLSAEQALHIINIVREGLSNALRHSRATRIVVSLRELVRTIRLTIRDDGIGFNTRSAQGVGHGLGNMAARAQKVRGSFALQSKPWKGTKILLDLPKDGHYAHN